MGFPLPVLSDQTQAFLRTVYGVVQFANLLLYLPHARRFFVSERWRGYGQSSPTLDAVQNPWVMPFVMSIWLASSLGIFLDRWTLTALAINLVFCWYYFVWSRWRGVLRGSGAPGLMNYWLAAAVFFTELVHRQWTDLHPLAVFVFQTELALILFTSGFYKFMSGFPQNEGMEYGLVNPQWGYWWRWYRRLSPRHWIYKMYDQCAWVSQILCAILMVIPGLHWIGGALLIASFLVIQTNIRLASLSIMMMLCGILFFEAGTPVEEMLWNFFGLHSANPLPVRGPTASWYYHLAIKYGLLCYLIMLPVVYGGLFFNFYTRKKLPRLLQKTLERYANFFGMILWRVFTRDLIDFYIQIYRAPRKDLGRRTLISHWEKWNCLRFRHVAESIAVTTLFTTPKYYPTQPRLFEERVLRYARTLPCSVDEALVFAYVRIVKCVDSYREDIAQEFLIDPYLGQVKTLWVKPDFCISSPPALSPVHETSGPGSYKPLHI